jgi:hypothetical protein
VIGDVQGAQTYLSNDKTGVYTEFTVLVDEVLKASGSIQISPINIITMSRTGGIVRYPSGHRRLHLVTGENFPQPGGKYVLFLKTQGQSQDFRILTAYQLTSGGVIPLDEGTQFEAYSGQGNDAFLKVIRNEITSSQ